MTVHANSSLSFASLNLGDRQMAVLQLFADGEWLSDREVAQRLGQEHLIYAVRPRLTELIKLGLLAEVGSQRDGVTGRKVRICAAARVVVTP